MSQRVSRPRACEHERSERRGHIGDMQAPVFAPRGEISRHLLLISGRGEYERVPGRQVEHREGAAVDKLFAALDVQFSLGARIRKPGTATDQVRFNRRVLERLEYHPAAALDPSSLQWFENIINGAE